MTVRMTVNGVEHDVEASPTDALLWVLRDDLGLTSAKYGCGAEQCGACRVLVDGVPAPSCALPVADVGQREVRTLEGLADDPATKPVIDALLAVNAGQCAYCLPGIVITLGHLARTAAPVAPSTGSGRSGRPQVLSRDEITAALDAHLCRCGSQPRIIAAALAALAALGGDGG